MIDEILDELRECIELVADAKQQSTRHGEQDVRLMRDGAHRVVAALVAAAEATEGGRLERLEELERRLRAHRHRDRAELHRRVAAAIKSRDPAAAEQNAALIAEHLEAAGDGPAAYGWHMRAATWATNRDIGAARLSWERAQRIADALPADDPNLAAMRIAPRTLLCGTAWRVHASVSGGFEDLRELCALADDKASLAIGITGMAFEMLWRGRVREASGLVSEQMALLESIADPALTSGLAWAGCSIKSDTGEIADILRWSQTVIDLAEGDPAKGATFGVGSPLAVALVWRGVARWWLGLKGWRRDLDDAVAMARCSDPATHAMVVTWKYVWAISYGVLLADHAAVHEIDEAMQAAEGSSDDTALTAVKFVLASALVQRDTREVQRGRRLVARIRETCMRERFFLQIVPMIDLYTAGERARRGDPDGAVPVMQKIVGDLFARGQFGHFVMANSLLVETLLNRDTEGDVVEAEEAIDRLANLPVAAEWAVSDVLLLRLRALLAPARGDPARYREYRDRYRDMARTLGYEGHIAWAEAMP